MQRQEVAEGEEKEINELIKSIVLKTIKNNCSSYYQGLYLFNHDKSKHIFWFLF